ncbi:MAG: tRNA1(Val) (adenine(37)-N6)-methyltransferase [Clostridiaceae bacterium]
MDIYENETLDDLQLKGIRVIQKKADFRFGVDAVLLANFAEIKKGARVVDLCTGTGIIPFIISGKKQPSYINGLEIQKEIADMASRSVKLNGLEDKINIINGDLKDKNILKEMGKYDVVTVNPPYKKINSGIKSKETKISIARHEISCTLEDVIIASKQLLKDKGKLYMVHRPERLCDIICILRKYKIEPKKIRMVHPYNNKAPNIMLIEAMNYGGEFLKILPPLYIHNMDGNYTEEINMIYGRDTLE